jgi:streptogramin lyase
MDAGLIERLRRGGYVLYFDSATERFTPANGEAAGVRQIHGRSGEVWGAASGEDALLLVRTSSG